MYDWDGPKGNYIMWKTIREGLEKIVKVERKRINVALRVVSAFRNSDPNNNSSPQTTISLSFMGVSTFAYISNPC